LNAWSIVKGRNVHNWSICKVRWNKNLSKERDPTSWQLVHQWHQIQGQLMDQVMEYTCQWPASTVSAHWLVRRKVKKIFDAFN
jgi:hypothetical protein